MKKIVLLLAILCVVPSISLAQFSRSVILPSNGLTLTEQLEAERMEAEKKAQEEAELERKRQEEEAQRLAEAKRLAEEERMAEEARLKVEKERIEAEKKAEKERIEAEKKAEAERKRVEAERKAEEERKKQEAAAEQARLEAERKAEQARLEAEKKAEQERLEAEQLSEMVAERIRIKNEEEVKKELKKEQAKLAKEKAKMERKERLAATPWSHIIMVNGGFSSTPDYTFGLTYAYVQNFGFYINIMTNFGFRSQSDGVVYAEGIYDGWYMDYYRPFFTGKSDYTNFSITAGAVARMVIPLYAYVGLGYGKRSVYHELLGGQWYECSSASTGNAVSFDVGLMGVIKGFTISLGYNLLGAAGLYSSAKIGVGYSF